MKYLLLYLSANFWLLARSQKQDTTISQTWVASINQFRFSKHLGSTADVQLRSKNDFLTGFGQASTRLGLVYFINDRVRVTAGHFYAANYIRKNVWQAEHSPWIQVFWASNFKILNINQSLRLEDRFRRKLQNNKLVDGYSSNYRARYNMAFQYPLNGKPGSATGFDALVYNELYINFGKQIIFNYFDQARFYAGLNYHINKAATLQLGYLRIFQQLAAGNQYRKLHVARIFYLHNFDFRVRPIKSKLPADISVRRVLPSYKKGV